MRSTNLAALLIVTALLLGGSGAARAARPAVGPSDRDLLARLDGQVGGGARVLRHAETGRARFVAMPPGRPLRPPGIAAGASPAAAARGFLGTYGQLFGLRDQARELRVARQTWHTGRSFVRFQQIYQGVPVMAGEIVVQADAWGAVVSANGEALPDLDLSVRPAVPAGDAARQALAAIARARGLAEADLRASPPELWIYSPALLGGPGPRAARLVWRAEVTANAAGWPIRELVLVDAQAGGVALHFDQVAHARQRYVCDANNQVDPDGNPDDDCVPAKYARVEGQAATGEADVDLAYDYTGITYDYFHDRFGRDSLDGQGMPLVSLVKYCPDLADCPMRNAGWDGRQMIYGDGFASADDVVAHELTHGLTQYTANLAYYYQSGAIDESLSDVFGELIDQLDGRGDDSAGARWLIGEDLPASFGVIRNMAHPEMLPPGTPGPYFRPSPDRMTSPYYSASAGDGGGVHINSGVGNKAAYLIVDGDTFNGRTIRGLGAAKAGAIYYSLVTAFLTSGSDYQDLYGDLPAACDALAATAAYGITPDDCAQVRLAVEATEMDAAPPLGSLDAPACAAGQASQDLFYDDMEDAGGGSWSAAALRGANGWHNPAPFAYATSGQQALWGEDLGGDAQHPAAPADYAIAMTGDVSLPPSARMHFRHAYELDAGAASYDGGVLEYSTDGGQSWSDAGPLFSEGGYGGAIDASGDNPLAGRAAFVGASGGYVASRLDLSPLAGRSARFRFRVGADSINRGSYLGWLIDDVRVYTCAATPPQVGWRATSASVQEGAGAIALRVRLSGVTDQPVRVPLGLGGTASLGADYTLVPGAVVVPTGAASAQVVITTKPDLLTEGDETIVLTLGAPANATLGGAKTAVVTIEDRPPLRRFVPLELRG